MRKGFPLFVFLCVPYLRIHCCCGDDLKPLYGQTFCQYTEEQCKDFFSFPFKGHTKNQLHYYTWATIEIFLRRFIGIVNSIVTWRDFGFYYGSVVGVGWYPQFLDFGKNFRIGFFDVFINFVAGLKTLFDLFFLSKKISCAKRDFLKREENKLNEYEEKLFLKIAIVALDSMPPDIFILSFILGGAFNFSIINIQMFSGVVRLKFLNVHSVAIFLKDDYCSFFANITKSSDGKDKNNSFYIYCYKQAGLPFFFKERDNILFPVLEALIPNIEINIGALH